MIHIVGDWYIEIDEHSYNLQQYAGETVDKDGKRRKNWKSVTYHGTLEQALIQFQQNQVRDALAEKDMEIAEAIEVVQTFNYLLKHTVETVLKAEKSNEEK